MEKSDFFDWLFTVTKLRTVNFRISAVKNPLPQSFSTHRLLNKKSEDSGNEIAKKIKAQWANGMHMCRGCETGSRVIILNPDRNNSRLQSFNF